MACSLGKDWELIVRLKNVRDESFVLKGRRRDLMILESSDSEVCDSGDDCFSARPLCITLNSASLVKNECYP